MASNGIHCPITRRPGPRSSAPASNFQTRVPAAAGIPAPRPRLKPPRLTRLSRFDLPEVC